MPTRPSSASEGFSSTPIKSESAAAKDFGNDVLSDDEDNFSQLSPIYQDNSDSEDDEDPESAREVSSRFRKSPVRFELPGTPSDQMSDAASQHSASPTLSAWEVWLVNKAKEDRLKLEQKAEEERLLKEKEERQERERIEKSIVMGEKIHEWLKMKREKKRNEQLLKKSKELEEIQRQQEKQREVERKAREKYKDWLQKKNQEKNDREKKEKEEAALKEEQEKERRGRAEEKFKEWLAKANKKGRASLKNIPNPPRSPYDKSCPPPSFYNPIPWKPIHVPPPEACAIKTSARKPQKQRRGVNAAARTLQRR
ncbi:unnamed protein product [Ophioblennius macclurei]